MFLIAKKFVSNYLNKGSKLYFLPIIHMLTSTKNLANILLNPTQFGQHQHVVSPLSICDIFRRYIHVFDRAYKTIINRHKYNSQILP